MLTPLQALLADRSPIPETSGEVFKITAAAELDTVLASNTYVVVDFYADWCPPCRVIAPVFSKLADEHALKGKLAFAKVNVDHVNDVAARYGVSAMPTFVFFANGKPQAVDDADGRGGVVDKIRGANPVALKTAVTALSAKVKSVS